MKRIPLLLILAGALFAGACSERSSIDSTHSSDPLTATLLPAPQALPDFALVDEHGAEQDASMFEGEWHLLFFGFANCPDICPTTLATLASATRTLRESNPASAPRIVLVSVDPDRDTPDVLRDYVSYFGTDTRALSGSEAALRELTTPLGVYFNRVPIGEDNYTVDHSSAVLLINPNGEFHALFSGPHKAENFIHDLPLILGTS